MGFLLVPKLTLNGVMAIILHYFAKLTLDGVMAIILHYFAEFGSFRGHWPIT